jgi:fermentation-respiration switch protein FrsA (DUF1100 family)
MRLARMLGWLFGIVLFIFIALLVFLYLNQGRMVFVPSEQLVVSPGEVGFDFENVYITVEPGVTLHGWYFPLKNSKKTILFCHGNAGNISHRLETVKFLVDLGANVMLFDYRGYGNSTGKPSEEGVYADAEAVYRWLRETKQAAAADIVIFGRSLGGAVGIELATRVPCAGVIVESSFTSMVDMGKKMFPFVPVGGLLHYKFESLDKIGKLSCPVLVAHSPDDDLIPYEMGRRLFEAAHEPKQFVKLEGGHNELQYFNSQTYIDAVSGIIFGLSKT